MRKFMRPIFVCSFFLALVFEVVPSANAEPARQLTAEEEADCRDAEAAFNEEKKVLVLQAQNAISKAIRDHNAQIRPIEAQIRELDAVHDDSRESDKIVEKKTEVTNLTAAHVENLRKLNKDLAEAQAGKFDRSVSC